MKYCLPYKEAQRKDIIQIFGINKADYQPNGHTGVDWTNNYGTWLVAPEKVRIVKLVTAEYLDPSLAPLERGFGVVMQSIENPDIFHLYWHCMAIFPVNTGDIIEQGQPVAQMGNSGFCISRGQVLPLDIRSIPPYRGTHVHWETYTLLNGEKYYFDNLQYVDYTIPINYKRLNAIHRTLEKIIKLLKRSK